MGIKIINFIFGTVRLKISGTFPERILNIANRLGIFIQDIKKDEEGFISFTVSCKGAKRLLEEPMDPSLSLVEISRGGIPAIFSRNKNRKLLFISPFIILVFLFISTQFVWTVNIIDADPQTEQRLLKLLSEAGVHRGALKLTINPSQVKNSLLLKDDSLMWIWVDIKGASAIVRYASRTPVPEIFSENESYNVYSEKDGIITSITPTTGMAKVKVGDTVTKGQLLIEGIMPVNQEENKFIHATGEVYCNVWEEKTVEIPKKNEIRTPTGKKTEHLSIKFKNFTLKLFINSSILYPKYDIIVNRRILSFIPVAFVKEEYTEVSVTYEDNDINHLMSAENKAFKESLEKDGHKVTYTEYDITDNGDYYIVTIRALCEEMVAAERRISHGENYQSTDN